MNRNSSWHHGDIYDYKIGWICDSVKDYGAACNVLDEELPSPSIQHPGLDAPVYRFWRLGEHMIVLNVPPMGSNVRSRGKDLAAEMQSKFTGIRFFLMVGLADSPINKMGSSAQPGDVVIGTRLVQYDLKGRKTDDSRLPHMEQSGFLGSSLTILFENRLPHHSSLQAALDSTIENIPNGKQRYHRPVSSAQYHIERSRPQQNSSQPRHGPSAMYFKPERSVRLYTGSIGLVSDAKERSILKRDIQPATMDDALCVEPKSVIASEGTNCVHVRGICGIYKQNVQPSGIWQSYAALAAAVSCREFLLTLPPESLSSIALIATPEAIRGMIFHLQQIIKRETQDAQIKGTSDSLRTAVQIVAKRMDELEIWMENLPNFNEQQLKNLDEEMKKLKEAELQMQEALSGMSKQIEDMIATALDDGIRKELELMKDQLNHHASRLDELSKVTNGAIQAVEDILSTCVPHDNQAADIITRVLKVIREQNFVKKAGGLFRQGNGSDVRPNIGPTAMVATPPGNTQFQNNIGPATTNRGSEEEYNTCMEGAQRSSVMDTSFREPSTTSGISPRSPPVPPRMPIMHSRASPVPRTLNMSPRPPNVPPRPPGVLRPGLGLQGSANDLSTGNPPNSEAISRQDRIIDNETGERDRGSVTVKERRRAIEARSRHNT